MVTRLRPASRKGNGNRLNVAAKATFVSSTPSDGSVDSGPDALSSGNTAQLVPGTWREVVRDSFGSYFYVHTIGAEQEAMKRAAEGILHILPIVRRGDGTSGGVYVGQHANWCVPVRMWLRAAAIQDSAQSVSGAQAVVQALVSVIVALRARGLRLTSGFTLAERAFVDVLSGIVVFVVDGALALDEQPGEPKSGDKRTVVSVATLSSEILAQSPEKRRKCDSQVETQQSCRSDDAAHGSSLHHAFTGTEMHATGPAAGDGGDLFDFDGAGLQVCPEDEPLLPGLDLTEDIEECWRRKGLRRSLSKTSRRSDSAGNTGEVTPPHVSTPERQTGNFGGVESSPIGSLGCFDMSPNTPLSSGAPNTFVQRSPGELMGDCGSAYLTLSEADPNRPISDAQRDERALWHELWSVVRPYAAPTIIGFYVMAAVESGVPETYARNILDLIGGDVRTGEALKIKAIPMDASAVLTRRCPIVLPSVQVELEYAMFADAGAYAAFGLSRHSALLVAHAAVSNNPFASCRSLARTLITNREIGGCMRPVACLIKDKMASVVFGTRVPTLTDALNSGSLSGREPAALGAVALLIVKLLTATGSPHGLLSAETITYTASPNGPPSIGMLPWAVGTVVPSQMAGHDGALPAHIQGWQGPSLFGGNAHYSDLVSLAVLVARLYRVPMSIERTDSEPRPGTMRIYGHGGWAFCLFFTEAVPPTLRLLLQSTLGGPIDLLHCAQSLNSTAPFGVSLPLADAPHASLAASADRFYTIDRRGAPLNFLGRRCWTAQNRISGQGVLVVPVWLPNRVSKGAKSKRGSKKTLPVNQSGAALEGALVERRVLCAVGRHPNVLLSTGSFVDNLGDGTMVQIVYGAPAHSISPLPPGPWPPAQAFQLHVQLTAALHALHSRGVCHGAVDADHVVVFCEAPGAAPVYMLAGFECASIFLNVVPAQLTLADRNGLIALLDRLTAANVDGGNVEAASDLGPETVSHGGESLSIVAPEEPAHVLESSLKHTNASLSEPLSLIPTPSPTDPEVTSEPKQQPIATPGSLHFESGPLGGRDIAHFVHTAESIPLLLRGKKDRATGRPVSSVLVAAATAQEMAAFARGILALQDTPHLISCLRLHVRVADGDLTTGTLICANPECLTLARYLKLRRTMLVREVVRLAAGLARALSALHDAFGRPIGVPLPEAYYGPLSQAMFGMPALAAAPPGASFEADREALADLLSTAARCVYGEDGIIQGVLVLIQNPEVSLAEVAVRLEAML